MVDIKSFPNHLPPSHGSEKGQDVNSRLLNDVFWQGKLCFLYRKILLSF